VDEDSKVNAALIGSTVGVAAFLIAVGIVLFTLFSILFGVCTYQKKQKMAVYVNTLLMISRAC
jgi:hypothetical membrane protein